MQVLNRLKMELSNQEYFTEEQYIQFLAENSLGSVKKFVSLVKNGSFLVRIKI